MAAGRQLVLDLAGQPASGRDDFLPAPANAAALAALERSGDWPRGLLLLIGPEGSGKSHLAAIWAAGAGARRIAARALTPAAADGLIPDGGALAVEDVERAAGRPEAEQALFHLANLAAARGARLLVTARSAPRDWSLRLPDLASRMVAAAQVRLLAPDEALLGAVLVKLFADRQLAVPPEVIAALVPRMARDLGLARRLVAAIDADALAGGRAVTRPLALATLARLQDEGAEELVAPAP